MQTLAVSLDAMVFFIAKGKFSYGEEWMSSCVYTYGNLRFAAPVAEDEVLPQELFVFPKSSSGLRLTGKGISKSNDSGDRPERRK